MGRIRPKVLVACEMCARIWSDMSYVGTHMWKRYPDDDDLVLWAYAADLLRLQGKRGSMTTN